MKFRKKNTYLKGLYAEIYALIYLFLKGYQPCAWRYRCYAGEIDLVVKKKGTVIGVEVKARKHFALAAESLGDKQKRRLVKALKTFQCQHTKNVHDLRLDFIAVCGFRIHHLKNAWSYT